MLVHVVHGHVCGLQNVDFCACVAGCLTHHAPPIIIGAWSMEVLLRQHVDVTI